MEKHGKNPLQKVIAIIPARYQSVRLAGKLLLPLAGKPLILHTVERSESANVVDRVVVATDSAEIADVVKAAGFECVMTSPDHESGTDRVAEASRLFPEYEIIVNVQGDEPMIDPETIDETVNALLEAPEADMSTSSEPVASSAEALDPNVVKVVTDSSGFAVYFSRSPVPYPRSEIGSARIEETLDEALSVFRKHTGLYVYRREFLERFSASPKSDLERIEGLEQLRAFELGGRIIVVDTESRSIGVDTMSDYETVRELVEAR